MMKIIFMGSPEFAVPSLQEIYRAGYEILAVVTNPDKRRGRREAASPTPVKHAALTLGIPVLEADSLKDTAFLKKLKELKPDVFVVVAFRILPKEMLEIPAIGSINLHASLLPKYRGAAPIHWAIINGETETGYSVFFLNEKMDEGDIIVQERTPIGPDETTGDVYERLMHKGAAGLAKAIGLIDQKAYTALPQKHEAASPAPKLFTETAQLDLTQPAETVHNKIRGLHPFPTAWAIYDDKKMNIHKSARTEIPSPGAGKLIVEENRLYVGCSDTCLELLYIQLPGTKKLSGSEFIAGYSTEPDLNS